MSNNQSPFPYVPTTNLITPPNSQLRHIRLLPAIWSQSAPLPDWSKIQQTIDLDELRNNRMLYERSLKPDFESKILNNKNINAGNKKLFQSLLAYYYISAMSPSIYGVYLDGQGLIDEVSRATDNRRTTKLLTRYADAMTAAGMFGVYSAHNNRRPGYYTSQANLSKSLFFDICALPIDSEFNPTEIYRSDWLTTLSVSPGIDFPLAFFPFEQIKSELAGAFNKTRANDVDFVNDLTSPRTNNLPTTAPDAWLSIFRNELQITSTNTNGLSLTKK